MEKKLRTDEEIIEGLKSCTNFNEAYSDCSNCPYATSTSVFGCTDDLMQDALALILRLKGVDTEEDVEPVSDEELKIGDVVELRDGFAAEILKNKKFEVISEPMILPGNVKAVMIKGIGYHNVARLKKVSENVNGKEKTRND